MAAAIATALGFAFEDWPGDPPQPRSRDDLRTDPHFLQEAADAVVAAVCSPNSSRFAVLCSKGTKPIQHLNRSCNRRVSVMRAWKWLVRGYVATSGKSALTPNPLWEVDAKRRVGVER